MASIEPTPLAAAPSVPAAPAPDPAMDADVNAVVGHPMATLYFPSTFGSRDATPIGRFDGLADSYPTLQAAQDAALGAMQRWTSDPPGALILQRAGASEFVPLQGDDTFLMNSGVAPTGFASTYHTKEFCAIASAIDGAGHILDNITPGYRGA